MFLRRRRPRWRTSAARCPGRRGRGPAQAAGPARPSAGRGRRRSRRSRELLRTPSSSQPRKASRLRVDSPREIRHSHSLRIDDGEPELEDRVERLVGVGQHRAEQPVDLLGGDRGQRQPARRGRCRRGGRWRRRRAYMLEVALEQPPVDALVVLVGLPADERVHRRARAAPTSSRHGVCSFRSPGQRRRRRRPRRSRPTRGRRRRARRGSRRRRAPARASLAVPHAAIMHAAASQVRRIDARRLPVDLERAVGGPVPAEVAAPAPARRRDSRSRSAGSCARAASKAPRRSRPGRGRRRAGR